MYIAYSALHQTPVLDQSPELPVGANREVSEPLLRYEGYQAACQKLSYEIAAIQKYIPGWMPVFR